MVCQIRDARYFDWRTQREDSASSFAPYLLLIAFQILPDPLFGIADGVGQFYFREIMSIKTLDVILMGRGHCFLRLDNFQVICNARAETVLRLCERLFGQVYGAACHLDLLGGGIQVEQSGPNFV